MADVQEKIRAADKRARQFFDLVRLRDPYETCFGFFTEDSHGESHAYRQTVKDEPCLCGLRRHPGLPGWIKPLKS